MFACVWLGSHCHIEELTRRGQSGTTCLSLLRNDETAASLEGLATSRSATERVWRWRARWQLETRKWSMLSLLLHQAEPGVPTKRYPSRTLINVHAACRARAYAFVPAGFAKTCCPYQLPPSAHILHIGSDFASTVSTQSAEVSFADSYNVLPCNCTGGWTFFAEANVRGNIIEGRVREEAQRSSCSCYPLLRATKKKC